MIGFLLFRPDNYADFITWTRSNRLAIDSLFIMKNLMTGEALLEFKQAKKT